MKISIDGNNLRFEKKIILFFIIIISIINKFIMGYFTLFLLNHLGFINGYNIIDLLLMMVFFTLVNINPIKVKFKY